MLTPLLLLTVAQAPQTVPLASLDLSAIKQGWGEPKANQSVDAHPLSIGGTRFATGLGTHATMRLKVELFGQAASFQAMVGVDDEVGARGSIQFKVLVDGKPRFDSGVLKGGEAAKPVNVDLKRAKTIELRVEDAGDDINYDHADWADATITLVPGAMKSPKAYMPPEEPPMPISMSESPVPEIHGARVAGCSPGKPFLFRIPATGEGPLSFSVKGLPRGLALDPVQGVISGTIAAAGDYRMIVKVTGPKGTEFRDFRIECGKNKLARTPPMGWNSWYVWGTTVTQQEILDAAKGLISSGLSQYGYGYVNIDDAWEAGRDANGEIQCNEKFPDMAELGRQVHALGLRFGIYSSPGPFTCAGYTATYQHELQDAQTYAKWGVDLLKYDWCSYGRIAKDDSLPEYQRPYRLMGDILEQMPRDIVYSLCQYGMGKVWQWGARVRGNYWRTTGDIGDSWSSISSIGFANLEYAGYARPGGWNDPDMLQAGYQGMGPNTRPTRLTKNEQVLQLTMWAMLAAPLIISCDLSKLDPWTKALLCNHEVIDIDQDPLGRAAVLAWKEGDVEVWKRPLEDGSTAAAVFNKGDDKATVALSTTKLGLEGPYRWLDCWLRKPMGASASQTVAVSGHGARLYRLSR